MDTLNNIKPTYTLNCKGELLVLNRPKIMGILNTTPDSFFDGGQYNRVDNALVRVEKMLCEGADILDIGGYSTRPGAVEVTESEEIDRAATVIAHIKKHFPKAILSIDTFRANVARVCIKEGAAIVNDISAGDDDTEMIPYVAKANIPYIIMHKQGTPQTMQNNPQYSNVVQEVVAYLAQKVALLRSMGVNDIVIDPGFGFGKTVQHNYQLLKHLNAFSACGVPILVGLSRKSLINKALGIKAAEALNGTTVVNTLALQNGANILRVHDVKEAKEAIDLLQIYMQQ